MRAHKLKDCTELNCNDDSQNDDGIYYDYKDYGKKRRRRRDVDYEDYDVPYDTGGGFSNGKTWMYDGKNWKEKKPIGVARDRPACSLISMPDGKVKIL